MMLLGNHAALRERISLVRQKHSFAKWELWLSILLFAVIMGMRYDVGVDYTSYLSIYKTYFNRNIPSDTTEFLFHNYSLLLAKKDVHFSVFFGVIAFIQILFLYLALRKQQYLIASFVFVFFTSGLFFSFMGGVRQTIVCALFVFSIEFIKRKQPLPYFIIILVGFFIHKSALVLIPLYFLLVFDFDWFKNRWLQVFLLLSAVTISSLNVWDNFLDILSKLVIISGYDEDYGKLSYSLSWSTEEYNKSVRYYVPLVIYIINSLFSLRVKETFKETSFKILYNLYFIGALSFFVFYNNHLLRRPILYFNTTGVIVCAYFLYFFIRRAKYDLKYVFISIIYIILHLGVFYAYIASDFHTQYKFFWEIV